MDDTNPERNSNTQTDHYPLLMEQLETHNVREHIIDITRNDEALSSSSHNDQHPGMHIPQNDDELNGSTQVPTHQRSFFASRYNSRNYSSPRSEEYGHRRRNPLNSGLWISVELVVTLSQIIASIVVLSISRNENPQAPLLAWIVGYASGCVAMLPILYWRYRNHNRSIEEDTSQSSQGSFERNPSEPSSYTAISVAHVSDEENSRATESATRSVRIPGPFSSSALSFIGEYYLKRKKKWKLLFCTSVLPSQHVMSTLQIFYFWFDGLVDHFKMVLDCFFAVWFVVGNVWIFGGHTSPSDAPKLYRLCIVFLTFSCIGYAMPFILCATICCCLPCIISILGIREDFSQNRGASAESINALPIYKFKMKENENSGVQDVNTAIDEGGVLAAGTEKERLISGEDAVCCICLVKYLDDDELRELPCSHVFHVECIDKWLKINASCPLCKSEVCTGNEQSTSATDTGGQQ